MRARVLVQSMEFNTPTKRGPDELKQFTRTKRVIGKRQGSCGHTGLGAVGEWGGKVI